MHPAARALYAFLCLVVPAGPGVHGTALSAQQHAGHGAGAVPETEGELSPRARAQIEAVRGAVAHLATPEAAARAGFREGVAWLPTMGTHWVSPARTRDGFHLLAPDHLMFSPVDGEPTLVGVAYAFRAEPGAEMPEGFDGALDAWHDHPNLAGPGRTLHMLHVWLVDSPDGPFAGHNPWLPFYAVGVEPPDASALADPEEGARTRELALALGATVDRETRFDGLFGRVADREAEAGVERRRAAIRSLVPALREARTAADDEAWSHLTDQAVAHWRAIREAYLAAAPGERARRGIARAMDRLTGAAGHH